MPTAIVSVTNDLTTDQRVDRTCQALVKAGYEVMLIGRRQKDSLTLNPRSYRMHRMRLLFDKGPLFYAEYNITLFFYLLLHKFDLLVSNDLDTLPANYLADFLLHPADHFRYRSSLTNHRSDHKPTRETSQPDSGSQNSKVNDNMLKSNAFTNFRKKTDESKRKSGNSKHHVRHLHDCHEYYRGVPELVGRKSVTRIWQWIEDRIFPSLEHVIAVNQSIAGLYAEEYGNHIGVVRNVPFRKSLDGALSKSIFHIRDDQKIILYQGAVNVDRGLEEAILAMKYLETDAILVIAGIGDIFDSLKKFTEKNELTEKVIFLGQVPFQELHPLTQLADIGLSIEKDVSLNYHYCLPNKFLDYIQANVPVLVSPFPEMKSIVDEYQIGEFIENHEPESLARKFDSMLQNAKNLAVYKHNLLKAAGELCWENEEKNLLLVIDKMR